MDDQYKDSLCNYCGGIGEVLNDDDGISYLSSCPRCNGSGLYRARPYDRNLTMREFFNKHMSEDKIIELAKKLP